jgi:hypothetical protein
MFVPTIACAATQALLAKFSEENSRLARENDKLRTGRAMLGAEHAGVAGQQ